MAAPTPFLPAPDADSEPFWTGLREGVLRIPTCPSCGEGLPLGSVRCPAGHDGPAAPVAWVEVAPAATVVGATVHHGPARPGLDGPFGLAVVALDEAPGVRMTLRVVGDDSTAVDIDDAVVVEIERHGDHAIAVARRTGTTGAVPPAPAPAPAPPPDGSSGASSSGSSSSGSSSGARPGSRPEDAVVLAGIGRSVIARAQHRSGLDLTVEAALAAVADAGLSLADLDGVATYPGAGVGPPGYSGPHTEDVARALGVEPAWHRGGAEGAGQLQPLFDAVLAVASGLCRHVLVYRTCTESTAMAMMRSGAIPPPAMEAAAGFAQWLVPFDAITPADWLAPYQAAHMHRYGTTRAQVGAVAVTARSHAALAPHAVFTDPLTIDDYLAARMISSPLGLLDCDVPVDGSVAVIVSARDTLPDLRSGAAVAIEAIGTGTGPVPTWHQGPDLTTMAAHGAAASMWRRTDLRPTDVDAALLYDGFAFLSLFWMEALGFCGAGESGPFVDGGAAIALDGALPLNPHGGQLSGGRLHGWGFLEEAIHQVRGSATGRQVADAEVAAVSTGGGPIAGCLLVTTLR